MPLTEAEELELLELEEEEARGGLTKRGGATRSFEKPSYLEMVQEDADRLARESLESQQKDPSAINKLLAPTRQLAGTMDSQMTRSLPFRAAAKGLGWLMEKLPRTPLDPLLTKGVAAGAQAVEKLPEPVKNISGIVLDVLGMIPASGAVAKATGKPMLKAAGATGRGLESAGVEALGGQMKIKASLAKRGYGPTIDIKKKSILKNISNYDLESVKGNFGTMARKALKDGSSYTDQADDILMSIANSPTAPRGQFVDDIITEALADPKKFADIGDSKTVRAAFDDIIVDAHSEGLMGTADKGIPELVAFKRGLNRRGRLFVEGPSEVDADNVKRAIKKRLYLSAVDKIEEFSPDAAALNRRGKDMFDIAAVAEDAASRTTNWNKVFNMSNMLAGLGGTGVYLQKPEALPWIIGGMAAKQAGGAGRGPAALMKTGKALQSAEKVGGKKIGVPDLGIKKLLKSQKGAVGGQAPSPSAETIQAIVDAAERHGGIQNIDMVSTRRSFGTSLQDGFLWYNSKDGSTHVVPISKTPLSQKGSIGGMAEKIVGTPAIRDPQTGKIYPGGWRGHKDAILKGEAPDIQERLKWEHFLDNTNKPTENVGFVDASGNFLSRTEAEKMVSQKTTGSLAQQFHNIGIMTGAGAAAGGGLGVAEIMKRRSERK